MTGQIFSVVGINDYRGMIMDIVKICLDFGASKAEEIPVSKLVLQADLHDYCKQNACGRYGKSYTCPPLIGNAEDLIAKLRTFDGAVFLQNIYPLEDSFDFEGMMDGNHQHNVMTLKIAERVYSELGREKSLVLAAGGCSICKTCGVITNEPCRDSQNAISSLEAYGVNVSQIGEVSGLKYINGINTVTYFSGVFRRDYGH